MSNDNQSRATAEQGGPLLSAAKLAERWECSVGWLANLRWAKQGPAYVKLGNNVRYRLADVLAYEGAALRGAYLAEVVA